MQYNKLIQRPEYQKILGLCIEVFNPTLIVSDDKKAILLNGEPIIAADKTVFEDGALLNNYGYQILRHVQLTEDEGQPVKAMAHNLSSSIYPRCTGAITEELIEKLYYQLSEDDQVELMVDLNHCKTKSDLFVNLRMVLELSMRDYAIEHSNNEEIHAWLYQNIDQNFANLIKVGLKNNIIIGLHQYFEMAQNKEAITAFFAKYPHMIAMLRTVWEAHNADQERKIFNTLKTIEDIERGDFMVEKYNQPYNYYNYGDCCQKFLADAKSWQWLLAQPNKIIKTVMKLYAVNDKKQQFAYHSFGRCRENISLLANLGLNGEIAEVFIKDLICDSLANDRFAIDIEHDSEILEDADFHSGQRYLNRVKLVFAYMDSKGMDLKTRIKFLKTFKHAITKIGFHVPYFKKHGGQELTDNQIIENWVQKEFKKLDNVTQNTYVPDLA